MKKILIIFVTMVFFAITANAELIFRHTQTVCNRTGERLVFKRDGTFEVWQDDVLQNSGTYDIEGDNYDVIIITVADDNGDPIELRCRASTEGGQTLMYIVFQNTTYNPNNC